MLKKHCPSANATTVVRDLIAYPSKIAEKYTTAMYLEDSVNV